MILTDTEESSSKIGSKSFYSDIIDGLSKPKKRLPSKYFYDKKGDSLFESIMTSPDYYLTRCEMEIFTTQAQDIVDKLVSPHNEFDLIELGPGNCAKSVHLLRALVAVVPNFNYVPIDISENVITELQNFLPTQIPGLGFNGLTGDYFDRLTMHCHMSQKRKVVMCLGGNIGNMTPEESNRFCEKLRSFLQPGDQCIIGFDLIKNPAIIRRAYDDRDGLTKAFNLNLLERINRELGTDIDISQFDHYCSYDPISGAAKSFLVCLNDLAVRLGGATITFEKDECIWTEISQKYSKPQIQRMASNNGFRQTASFFDRNSWFMDAIWTAI